MDLWKFAAVALFAVVVAQSFGVGWGEATHDFDVDNESAPLRNSGAYVEHADVARTLGASVTVLYNGSALSEGTDYRWNESTGELSRLSGSAAPDGASVLVSYDYQAASRSTKTANTVLGAGVGALPYLLVLVAGIVALGFLSSATGGR